MGDIYPPEKNPSANRTLYTHIGNKYFRMQWAIDSQTFQELDTQTVCIKIIK